MTQLNSEILAIEWTPPPPDVCSLPGILPSEISTFGPHELGLVDSIFPGNVTPPDFFPPFSLFPQAFVLI